MVMPNLLKDMILTPQQYVRPVKTKGDSSTNKIAEEEFKIVNAENKPKLMGLKLADDESNENEVDEVSEVNVATYELRSKTGETRMRGVKSLKWPVLTEWDVTPAEVLKMQMEDKTLDKYWKMAREETGERTYPVQNKEGCVISKT